MRSRKPRFATRNQRPPKDGVGWSRHAYKAQMLAFVDVKLRQTESRECCHQKSRERHHLEEKVIPHPCGISHMVEQGEQHGRRGHTKRHAVGQRIEFQTQFATHAQRTCRHAIKEIEEGTQQDKKKCNLISVMKRTERGDASTYQIAASNNIRNMFFHFTTFISPTLDLTPPSVEQSTSRCQQCAAPSSPAPLSQAEDTHPHGYQT